MKNIITEHNQGIVKILKGEVICNSLELAEYFGKSHAFVLKAVNKAIENLKKDEVKIDFISAYFKKSNYLDKYNREKPKFNITFKGFNLVGLAFTGEKAFVHRVKFIDAFESLLKTVTENKLLAKTNLQDSVMIQLRKETKEARSKMTSAINEYFLPQRVAENLETSQFVSRYIASFTRLTYKSLGITMPKGVIANRDVLSARELIKVEDVELKIATSIKKHIDNKVHYKEVYQLIKKDLL